MARATRATRVSARTAGPAFRQKGFRNFGRCACWGNVLTAGLAGVITAIVVRLFIQHFSLGILQWRQDFIDYRLGKAVDITCFFISLVFVVWLWRARINAERSGLRQRRARGWAFWGWIIPVADLFVPFQMIGDIRRAGLPATRRRKVAAAHPMVG